MRAHRYSPTLLGLLAVAALAGCQSPPPSGTGPAQAPEASSRAVQGALNATLGDLTLTPAAYLAVQQAFEEGDPSLVLEPFKLLAAAASASLPASSERHGSVKAAENGAANAYVLTPWAEATHVLYNDTESLLPLLNASLGSTPATRITMAQGWLEFHFPIGATGSLKVTSRDPNVFPGCMVKQRSESQPHTLTLLPQVETDKLTFDTPTIATLRFKVTTPDGKGVAGLQKDNFELTLYAKTSANYDRPFGETPIDTFQDLREGNYLITAPFSPFQATGSLRVKLNIVNAPATIKASLFRQ
ncbi:hypothetical protein J7643_18000 [bacterium]|nr:hypothetical protein [bacterium]